MTVNTSVGVLARTRGNRSGRIFCMVVVYKVIRCILSTLVIVFFGYNAGRALCFMSVCFLRYITSNP